MIIGKVGQVRLIENRMEFILQEFSVPGSDPKDDQGADVAKDSATDLLIELLNILMCEDQGKAVFSCFGKDITEALSQKVMESA
jgi:hypothetical protein